MKKLKKIKLQSQNVLDVNEMRHIVGGQYNNSNPKCGTGTDAGKCNGVCDPKWEKGQMISQSCYKSKDLSGYYNCFCL